MKMLPLHDFVDVYKDSITKSMFCIKYSEIQNVKEERLTQFYMNKKFDSKARMGNVWSKLQRYLKID